MSVTDITRTGALSGVRVLDLTGKMGNYCGKLFVNLGAHVTLIEPPGGSSARHHGPYLDENPDIENSIAFAYLNTGKKSVVLDLDQERDRRRLKEMVAEADVLIEDMSPGRLASRDLGPKDLAAINPALVYTSITSFGQTGPYSSFVADDLTLLALGGMLYLGGYADGMPVSAYGQQAYMAASVFAAVATMGALLTAEETGEGEHIDVSAQECVVMAMENAIQFFELEGTVRKRYGGQQRQAGSGVFPCKDGYFVLLAGGIAANRFWKRFIGWMADEGVEGSEDFQRPEWLEMSYLSTPLAKAQFEEIFGKYAKDKTKAELYEKARERLIPLAPVATPADILRSPQLNFRKYFVDVEMGRMARSVRIPGAPYKLSATPWSVTGAPPKLGEHGDANAAGAV